MLKHALVIFLFTFLFSTAGFTQQPAHSGFDWYLTQDNTGEYSGMNCGPTSAVMAATWYYGLISGKYEGTVEEARNSQLMSRKGGWSFVTIERYLSKNKVSHFFGPDGFRIQLAKRHLLEDEAILIVAINPRDISERDDFTRTGRYYDYSIFTGHYIILKGYTTVDDVDYFEVYDPALGYYFDGSYKGRNRLYSAKEVEKSGSSGECVRADWRGFKCL